MEGQHNISYKANMYNDNKGCGIKATEFDRILIMTPDTKLENPDQKMYKTDREKTPWVVKNMSGLEFPLITNEIDRKTLGKSISQDTCLTAVGDDIDLSRFDISTSNNQINMNEKISKFLKWDDSFSEQKNEYHDILLKEYQSKPRLPSGLDEYNNDSRDINDIEWSNSNHVCWDEEVKYYRYPKESSLSTIDIRSDQSKINDIPRTRSQPCLLDNYFSEINNSNSKKQKNIFDTFWKEIGEIENSFKYSSVSNTKKKFQKNINNYPDYSKYDSIKCTNNINGKQSNQEKKYLKWNKEDSIQNQFKNDHPLNTLNLESHLNIANMATSKCHIYDGPDSISKRHKIEDLKQSTNNEMIAKGVNQITHQTDNNTEIQKVINYLDKSEYDQTLCEKCSKSHFNKEKIQTNKNENSLVVKRNKKLRELLGLKPEEKNVLVMLQL